MSTPLLDAPSSFESAARMILDYLNAQFPLGLWSITRVENGRQTHLALDANAYGLRPGDSVPWEDTYCVHMTAGAAPRIAPHAATVPAYAGAAVNDALRIGAYAGEPITEPDGSLFGVICGLDPSRQPGLESSGPVLELLAGLLTNALAADRARRLAETTSRRALTEATTDSLTGIPNRRAWDERLVALDRDYRAHADPTVVVVVDLDGLKQVNDGPGGHAAGDELLRTAAHVLRRSLRDRDFVARLGGDEFGIVLADCPTDAAHDLAVRLEGALVEDGVDASVGWAPLRLSDGGAQAAMVAADHAMYAVKARRRLRPVASWAKRPIRRAV